MTEQVPPTPPRKRSHAAPVIAGALLLAGLVGGVLLWARKPATPPGRESASGESSGPSAIRAGVDGLPRSSTEPVELSPPDEQLTPAIWLEVYELAGVKRALSENPWMKKTLNEPLGRGFAGQWAGFFGTRGEDLGATFKGALMDLAVERLLGAPFYVVWFAGDSATGAPALVVPSPGEKILKGFDSLDSVARRGIYEAPHCPGAPVPAKAAVKPPPIRIYRWLVAEQAVYASRDANRVVFSRNAGTALQAVCAGFKPMERPGGTDFALAFSGEALGREPQLLQTLVGLGGEARLGFRVDGTALSPTGLRAPVADAGRLAAATPSPELLKLIPEDVPVVLTVRVNLPEQLTGAALATHFEAGGKKKRSGDIAREITVIWQPRGDASLDTELAVIWSRTEDEKALAAALTGPNQLMRATTCGHLVLASSGDLLGRIQRACAGKTPSLANAPGPVIQGLKEKSSLALGVNLGRLLSQLALDGWRADSDGAAPVPPEIEAARRELEELPFFGFRSLIDGSTLVTSGFRS